MPTTMSRKAVLDLMEYFSVKPSDYTKPIRLYVDVNGVVEPIATEEELAKGDLEIAEIDAIPNLSWEDEVTLNHGRFWWNKPVIERLAALSRHPKVDFVWLTDWRVGAPHALDPLLGIESVGYLDWQRKFSDYGQSFKRVAIEEEQEEAPSKFIWVDDRANEYEIEDVDYLNIVTNGRIGLTMAEMDIIEAWVEANA